MRELLFDSTSHKHDAGVPIEVLSTLPFDADGEGGFGMARFDHCCESGAAAGGSGLI